MIVFAQRKRDPAAGPGRNAAMPALCTGVARRGARITWPAPQRRTQMSGPRANCGAASSRHPLALAFRSSESRAVASASSRTCQCQSRGDAAGVGIAGLRGLSMASPTSSQDSLRAPSPWRLRPVITRQRGPGQLRRATYAPRQRPQFGNIGHLLGLELGRTVWLLASKVVPGGPLLRRDSHGVGDLVPLGRAGQDEGVAARG